MARIPYLHVDLVPAPGGGDLAALDELLAADATDGELGGALEAVVRTLADNRRALLPHRAVAPALTATVKDPWCAEPPVLDTAALIAALPDADTVSVRLDAKLTIDTRTDGPLGRAALDGPRLRFARARRPTAEVTGPPARLALLERLVAGRPRIDAAGLAAMVLPKDLAAFEAVAERRAADIQGLLDHGRELIERAERLVCRLYGLPAELEDEVVAHATARAVRH